MAVRLRKRRMYRHNVYFALRCSMFARHNLDQNALRTRSRYRVGNNGGKARSRLAPERDVAKGLSGFVGSV